MYRVTDLLDGIAGKNKPVYGIYAIEDNAEWFEQSFPVEQYAKDYTLERPERQFVIHS